MNPDRYLINTTRRWTSTLKKLRKEGKINEQFEVQLGNLTLEEIIAIKLELSSRTLNSPLYGLPLWQSLINIVQDAVLKFAISSTNTSSEAARVLGIDQKNLVPLIKKFKIYDYFGSRKRNLKKKLMQEAKIKPT